MKNLGESCNQNCGGKVIPNPKHLPPDDAFLALLDNPHTRIIKQIEARAGAIEYAPYSKADAFNEGALAGRELERRLLRDRLLSDEGVAAYVSAAFRKAQDGVPRAARLAGLAAALAFATGSEEA